MLNQLIYGDIRSSSGGSGDDYPPPLPDFYPDDIGEDDGSVPNELLHAKNGRLIYSDGCGVILWTWWDFNQSGEENQSPIAYINGKNVCGGNATSHIVEYKIERNKIYGSKASVTIYVKMKMGSNGSKESHWNGGASCTHRIWGGGSGTTGDYYSADPNHRAEKGGTCGGGATFKVVFDTNAGTYRIS